MRRSRDAESREFLPAALEILDTPANPIGRAVALTLGAFFVIAVAWAWIGEIDIVAVAQGRVVPVGGVKVIQPREIGNVRGIFVTDGQHVDEGELLIELDPTESEVDRNQLLRDRMEAAIQVARLLAYINGLNGDDPGYDPPLENVDPAIVAMHRSQLESDLAAFNAELATVDSEFSRRIAERHAIEAEVQKMTEVIPLLADREASLLELMEGGYAPRPVWQEAKTALIETQHDLAIQRHHLSGAESRMEAVVMERNRIVADRQQQAYQGLSEARNTLAKSDLALQRVQNREDLHSLRAPVAGTVQQLAAQTIGGVVQPAEPLMIIVPDDAPLEVRAQVLNRDAGFVTPDQAAEIKLEAFNFTKYGTIDGSVASISSDAIEDEQLGLVYDSRIALRQSAIQVDGEEVPLTPGMSVTVEIKTGTRPVIEFLLSPLQRYQHEAIRER